MQKPPEKFPTAIIFSELDELSFCLCKIFLDKGCLVKIICKAKEPWQRAKTTEELSNLELSSLSHLTKDQSANYVIYHLNSFKLSEKSFKRTEKEERGKIPLILKLINNKKTKSVFLLPSNNLSRRFLGIVKRRLGEDLFRNVNTIFYGETIGPYWRPSEEGCFGIMAKQAAAGLPVGLAGTAAVSPLASSQAVAETAVKVLLSFGQGTELYITGANISSGKFFAKLQNLNPFLKSREEAAVPVAEFSARQRILVSSPTDEEISESLVSFREVTGKRKGRKVVLNETKKAVIYFVFSVCFFLILPYLVFATGTGFLIGAGILGVKQDMSGAEKLLFLSQGAASTSKRGFWVLVKLPLGKQLFGPGLFGADLLERTANVGLHATSLFNTLKVVSEKFFSDESYEVVPVSERLFVELDFIYRELGFLQGEIGGLSEGGPFLLSRRKASEAISLAREKISYAKEMARELPWILGDKQKRIYLVLLQNNMELRPTGGYIGSFALMGVERGRLAGVEVQDVFTADGQLKGHVESPEAIKKYLGEAGWFLRDSNWDPDFAVSAQRAEWFLDKELGIQVDGVIALDLEAARKLLDVVGEVRLNDFSKTVTSQNLYEQTREEIEENFFPGSRTKASFLAAVASSLISKISEADGISRLRLVPAIVSGLEERNIQLFVHNAPSLKAIAKLGWSGELPSARCENPCVSDWVGLAEANLGVNKANYYIERKADLSVVLSGGKIQKSLVVTWKNNAPEDIGEKGKYKAYIRVLSPRGEFNAGQKKIGQAVVGFAPDVESVRGHVEAGTIIEVFPQESSTLAISWTSPIELPSETGEYILAIRKQAGTVADPWEIQISSQLGKNIITEPQGFLTGNNAVGYNTFLARDFVSRISW